MNPRLFSLATALIAASTASAQTAAYRVTFNVNTPLDHVFVYADEWNGSVYAWDLFPAPLGSIPAGTSSFSLGTRNIVAWAVIATHGPSGVCEGINDSLSTPPDGRSFEAVFSGYSLPVVQSNTATLWNGAFNTQQAFYLTEFVLAVEDTLKTDLPTGTLAMYTFNNGVNVGTATFSVAVPCYANCDSSTTAPILTANDFQCFLNKFAAADTTANCDGSTSTPLLTANDFQCFLNAFAAGCP